MPDAPAPVFDRHGNVVCSWELHVAYDGISDEIVVSWHQAAGPYSKEERRRAQFPSQDPAPVLRHVEHRLTILTARRLF